MAMTDYKNMMQVFKFSRKGGVSEAGIFKEESMT